VSVREAVDLDDLDEGVLSEIDPDGMLDLVERSPEQWAEALDASPECPDPRLPAEALRHVIVAGMGGSGIAGDVAAVAAREIGGVPVVPVKGHDLPASTGPDTLVIAVSYSGGTAETINCYEQAGEVGAPRYVICGGGELGERALADGVPSAIIEGEGPPRANLATLTVPLLALLEGCDLLPSGVISEQLGPIAGHLDRLVEAWGRDVPTEDNTAKAVARGIGGRVTAVYGAGGWPALVARRAKNQLNENAKRPAWVGEAPELAHNEIVGWWGHDGRDPGAAVLLLRSPHDERTSVSAVLDATADLLEGRLGAVLTATMTGRSPLERFAAGALLVDLVSVYVALAAGIDPTPIEAIDELKRRTAP
jgi:glucose/mannose-6-phosphate isomerase